MIAVVDYGMGNLRSAQKGLEKAGCEAMVTRDPDQIARADGVVLPGVGAFKDCYDGLANRGLVEPVLDYIASGRPFLGICVGMQLLFDGSEEGVPSPGLGVFKGRVVRFPDPRQTRLKVPHMGWNALRPMNGKPCTLLDGLSPNPYVYFVHSYHAAPEESGVVLATANYGVEFPAVVGKDNVYGVQFHPEKSQGDGIAFLKAFGGLTRGDHD